MNNTFYTKAYKEHGVSAKGLHWNSKETQYKRFEVLTSFLSDLKKHSIIDVGCGFGEYLNYLEKVNIKPDIYLGIDCEEFILEIARKQFPKHVFLNCNILFNEIPKADYIFCSGALNILPKSFFLKAIENCFKSCNKGFAFNFLTKESIHKLKKEEILNFCKLLTKKISIENNYLDNDCSFYLQK